jgi:murein DD-endopeptidase MepM/ murein hydrolase activator NlpD
MPSLGDMVNRPFIFSMLGVSLLGIGFVGVTVRARHAAEHEFQRQVALAAEDAARTRAQTVLYSEQRVGPGETFSESLQQLGVEPSDVADIVGSARPVYNLRHMRAGNRISIGRSVTGELRAVRYQIDPERMLEVKPGEDGFTAEIESIPSRTEVATVGGELHDSLFGAVTEAGESPELAVRLAQIFGWDLDFYTDPREGDTFRVVVEKKRYLDGKMAAYGRILAAEYDNDGHPYRAMLFHDSAGRPGYYAPDGKSLQKAFLRSPLKFAAPITSGFSKHRFHPILKTYRPHLGIDYGAPTGTPVQAIGAGRVVFAGRKGGDGNMVRIAHSNGYDTMYLHLSRILVRPGQRVDQGQRIGLVGMTGLATGPHLDFRILQHGVFKNFLAMHLPPARPVSHSDWNEFAADRERWIPMLEGIQIPDVHDTAIRDSGSQAD